MDEYTKRFYDGYAQYGRKQAEEELKEKLAAQAALEKAHTEILHLTAANSHIAQERDEARKWARFYQALAQSWKKAYENTWKNNRVIPK